MIFLRFLHLSVWVIMTILFPPERMSWVTGNSGRPMYSLPRRSRSSRAVSIELRKTHLLAPSWTVNLKSPSMPISVLYGWELHAQISILLAPFHQLGTWIFRRKLKQISEDRNAFGPRRIAILRLPHKSGDQRDCHHNHEQDNDLARLKRDKDRHLCSYDKSCSTR